MSSKAPTDPRVLIGLREWAGTDAQEISDEKLLEMADGSLFLASLQLQIAASDFIDAAWNGILGLWRRIRALL